MKNIFLKAGISLFASFLLLGCNSDNSSSEEITDAEIRAEYPAVVEVLGFDATKDMLTQLDDGIDVEDNQSADDTTNMSLRDSTNNIYDFSKKNIETMIIGAQVDLSGSKFQNLSIFDIPALNKDGLVDINQQSAAGEKQYTKFTTSKEATSTSSDLEIDSSATSKFLGFKGGYSFHMSNKSSEYANSGKMYFTMMYLNTGGYVRAMVDNFVSGNDFESYLRGDVISDENLSKYVNVTVANYDSSCTQNCATYYDVLSIDEKYKLEKEGYNSSPYGVIQQLKALEDAFWLFKEQYNTLIAKSSRSSQEEAVLDATNSNLITLREHIKQSIDDFYAVFGTHFVSYIGLSAYGMGYGELHTNESAENTESTYGGSLTAGYKGLSFGLETKNSAAYAYQHGWSNSNKNMNIEVFGKPANTIDVSEWSTSIQTALNSADTAPPTIPTLSSAAADISYKWADAAEKKDKSSPPDSCFKSYADWKSYKADEKAEEDKKALEKSEAKKPLDQIKVDDEKNDKGELFNRFADNFDKLEVNRQNSIEELLEGISEDNKVIGRDSTYNTLRIDNKIVTSFEAVPYDKVLSALRPDLRYGSIVDNLDAYPILSELLVLKQKLGKLEQYVKFNALYRATNAHNIAPLFGSFVESFNEDADDYLIYPFSRAGADINETLFESFKSKYFGNCDYQESSELLSLFNGDRNRFKYICYLLEDNPSSIWLKGGGGYLPVRDNYKNSSTAGMKKSSDITYTQTKNTVTNVNNIYYPTVFSGSIYASSAKNEAVKDITNTRVSNYAIKTSNILMQDFSEQFNQTPLFPLFVMQDDSEYPELWFVQHFGQMEILYGSKNVLAPEKRTSKNSIVMYNYSVENPSYESDAPSLLDSSGKFKYENSEYFLDDGGFDVSSTNWSRSLKFYSDDNQLIRDTYNVLVLDTGYKIGTEYTLCTTTCSFNEQMQKSRLESYFEMFIASKTTFASGKSSNGYPIVYRKSITAQEMALQNSSTGAADNINFKTGNYAKTALLPLGGSFYDESTNKPFSMFSRYSIDDIVDNEGFSVFDTNSLFK